MKSKKRIHSQNEEVNKITTHHKKPTSIGGDNKEKNKSLIKQKYHSAWHLLFKNFSAMDIIILLNNYYLDPDYPLPIISVKMTEKQKVLMLKHYMEKLKIRNYAITKNKKRSWDILLFFNML